MRDDSEVMSGDEREQMTSDGHAIATAVRDAAAARCSSAAASATISSAARRKDLDLEVFGVAGRTLRGLLERFGRVDTVGESFAVFYKVGGLDVVAAPPRVEDGPRPQGLRRRRRSAICRIEDAARRRDFTINAISRDPLTDEIVDPFDGRAISTRAACASSIPGTFGDDSLRVLRALQFAARFELTVDEETRAILPVDPARRSPARTVWGEVEKLLLQARRPSIGFALALRPRRRRSGSGPELHGAHRLSAGTGVASRRRRLDSHADGDRRGARSASTASIAARRRR